MCHVLHESLEFLLCFIPLIIFICHKQFFGIWIQEPLSLAVVFTLPFFLELAFNFLAFVSSYVNRVASLAPAVLTTCRGQCASSLHSWHLAEAAFSSFGKGLHALTTATIFHDKFGHLQVTVITQIIVNDASFMNGQTFLFLCDRCYFIALFSFTKDIIFIMFATLRMWGVREIIGMRTFWFDRFYFDHCLWSRII